MINCRYTRIVGHPFSLSAFVMYVNYFTIKAQAWKEATAGLLPCVRLPEGR